MIRHLAGIAEIVDDLSVALAFYRDTLGLEVKQQVGDDYAVVVVPGILHFGVWNRAHAALSTFGSRDAAERIPLGFTVEFEVDDTEVTSREAADGRASVIQSPRLEPWGQKTCRAIAPGGGIVGFAETPWGRVLKQQVEATASVE